MKHFVLFSFALIVFAACQKENLNIPDTGRKIAINGLITTDTLLNVRITKSAFISDITGTAFSSRYDIDSAEVRFYQNSTPIDSLHHAHYDFYEIFNVFYYGNYWSHSVYPLPGQEYEVVVKRPGLPDATAITTIPDLVRIEHIDTSRVILAPGSYYENNSGMQFKIEFSDPVNGTNYYLFRMYMNTYWDPYYNSYVPYNSKVIRFSCQDPVVEEKLNNINGLEAIAFSDKVINGQTHSLNVIVKGESIGKPFMDSPESSYINHRKTLYFKLYSITEEYFRYIQILHLYSKNYSNPLAEPVLMYSNVTGGYGMFSGASVSNDSIVFKF